MIYCGSKCECVRIITLFLNIKGVIGESFEVNYCGYLPSLAYNFKIKQLNKMKRRLYDDMKTTTVHSQIEHCLKRSKYINPLISLT